MVYIDSMEMRSGRDGLGMPAVSASRSTSENAFRVATWLSDESHARVVEAVGVATRLPNRQFDAVVINNHYEVLVVDVVGRREDAFEHFLRMATEATYSIVLYSELTSSSADRFLASMTGAVTDVILQGLGDAAHILRARLAPPIHRSVSAATMAGISTRIAVLPPQLSAAVIRMLAGARVPSSVAELATQGGMPRRSLDRWLQRAELGRGSRLLTVGRLLRLRALVDQGREHGDAILACYQSYETARRHCARVFGTTPEHVLSSDRRQFVDRIVEYVAEDRGDVAESE